MNRRTFLNAAALTIAVVPRSIRATADAGQRLVLDRSTVFR